MISRRDLIGRGSLLAGSSLLLLSGCNSAKTEDGPLVGTPKRGGRIRVGTVDPSAAGNLDAHKPTGAGIIRGWALYSKLWEWTPDVTPRLALAEEAEIAPDGRSWVIRLKKGLEFHHGKTIGADDVIFSIRRLTDPNLASPFAALLAPIDRDHIDRLDDRTIRLHARADQGLVPLSETWISFGGIVPTDYHPVTNPVGAGPFRLKEFSPGQRSVYTRFENYFKPGQPYVDELEIIEFKDQQARTVALLSGQIDVADIVPAEQARLLSGSSLVDIVESPTNGVQSFDMNLKHPIFADERVRQAFRLFADRGDLVQRALQGKGRIANDLYAPHDPTYDLAIPQRVRDVAQARSLLKQAGKSDLAVELVASPAGASAALVFAEQAKDAGINIRVKKVDEATFYSPEARTWAISTGSIPARGFLASGLHADAPTAVSNRTNFHDPRFGALFNAALAQPDIEKRKLLVHEAQKIQHQRGGLLIWGFAHVQNAASKQIGGLGSERTQFAAWRFDELWRRDT
ncbi:hypothetical protein L288_20245 [Sphingobium quisquiliarum P25]|uniref:Solute-binding protein family 5 domain-containing protein n=2 Tax=Sphingobium quisquiliarum TaxID=538379 RepID=T0GDC9_9SPHN|nr:hypothetical protein L288_20245 [Sphingobium quisquiliarum P25]